MKGGRTSSERQSSHKESTCHKKSAVWMIPRLAHLVFNHCAKGAAIQRGWVGEVSKSTPEKQCMEFKAKDNFKNA
jgi:hypothetical protein